MISKKKKLLFCLILLLLPVLAVVLLEFGLRLFWPQPPRGFSDNLFATRNGVRVIGENCQGRHYSREFNVKIAGNTMGYRDCPGFNPALPADLILLGDSFCFGWGVKGEDTAGSVIAVKQGWNVYLVGMPGDGIFAEKKRLQLLKTENRPPIVLLFFDNDLSDYIGLTAVNANPETLALPVADNNNKADVPLNLTSLRWKLLESHVVRLAARMIDICGLSDIAANATGSGRMQSQAINTVMSVHRKQFFESPAWTILKAEYADFIKLARSKTDRLIIIRIVPPFFTTLARADSRDYDFTICDKNLKSLCDASNVPYYVFEPADTAGCYFKYDMHLNPAGHQELAWFILNKLKEYPAPERKEK
jgi:hypothetical protein